MNRIERISAILILLQSKSVVTAHEIGDRFGISVRTVYRDIRSLEESGVPIAAEAGIGYSLAEGYKLPPVQFTLDEATAFLTAEKIMEKLTDENLNESFQSGITKLKSILRTKEKLYLETIEKQIRVVENNYLPKASNRDPYLSTLIAGIANKKVIEIDYLSGHKQELTKREIEPIGLFYSSPFWHLIAYCRLRKDYRQFRLDRIERIQVTGVLFERKHKPLDDYLRKIEVAGELMQCSIEFDNSVLRYLGNQIYYNGFVDQITGEHTTILNFVSPSLEGMARWYLMVADHARILSPDQLKIRVREIYSDLKKNIDE